MLKEEFSEKIKEYMNKINIEISDKQIELYRQIQALGE